MMMNKADQLKAELMEMYGLREDQVRLQVTFSTTDLVLGNEILADFDKYKEGRHDYLVLTEDCAMVYGESIDVIYVHRKDGFYGRYVNEVENDDE